MSHQNFKLSILVASHDFLLLPTWRETFLEVKTDGMKGRSFSKRDEKLWFLLDLWKRMEKSEKSFLSHHQMNEGETKVVTKENKELMSEWNFSFVVFCERVNF